MRALMRAAITILCLFLVSCISIGDSQITDTNSNSKTSGDGTERLPDLRVTNVLIEVNHRKGGPFRGMDYRLDVYFEIENLGDADANAVELESLIGGAGAGIKKVGDVPAKMKRILLYWEMWCLPEFFGQKWVYGTVDPRNRIREKDKRNNRFEFLISVDPVDLGEKRHVAAYVGKTQYQYSLEKGESSDEAPRLSYEVTFMDANGDGILSGSEEVVMSVKVKNQGNRGAVGVKIVLSGDESLLRVFGRLRELGDIAPSQEKAAQFRGIVPSQIKAGNSEIKVSVQEAQGHSPSKIERILVATKPAEIKESTQVISSIADVDVLPARPSNIVCKECYAVVIGISKYRSLPVVKYARNDAEIVAKYLETVGGVPRSNIKLLEDEAASKADIEAYIEEWLPRNVRSPDSTVFVYFSGHGTPGVSTDEPFLVPYEGDPDFIKKLYPLKTLYESLNNLPANKIVVMLDTCFVGAGGRSVIPEGARPAILSMKFPILGGGKIEVLTAGMANQISSDYDRAQHGLFTYYLLKGLGGRADKDRDGAIKLGELYEYVKSGVSETAQRELNREQTPMLFPEYGEGRDFTIAVIK